ncbi:Fanconi anemia group I protein isoform X1 [Amborella trichopoda]|uniref:Fanconi anemia group I protein n=2 Tax=Amborella trichopoda TaxID=13333 RepID=W1P3M7_AMBTC|nr:Fanconi anemia group I protein isoform X1 [Amborella trichopoda]ERN02161.1 hypothetical protein AMTR_s00045p00191080 [Amborella trichopoda]|eukprot:XP_020520504.1 Fanconi anemia group I protein isoform X1 [Amborella trichopoda]
MNSQRSETPTLTEEEIIQLAESSAFSLTPSDPLLNHLLSAPECLILSLLSKSESPSLFTKSIFSLLSPVARSSPESSSSRILLCVLLEFISLTHHERTSLDTFSLIAESLDALPVVSFSKISESLLSLLDLISEPDDALPLELLPSLLSVIKSSGSNGPDCADTFLRSILDRKWPRVLLIKMVLLLRDLPLNQAQAEDYLKKVFVEMEEVDLQDLPSIVYHLLIMASKGLKKPVVLGIIGFFGKIERGPGIIYRQVQGTVLLHVNFSVKQDPSIGHELLGLVKSDIELVTHFSVAMLLSVARIRRFTETAISLLKSVVTRSHREHRLARDCKWVPDLLKDHCLLTVRRIEQAVLRTVQESNNGREHILPSIVQLGFCLLESLEDGNGKGDSACDPNALMGIEELGMQTIKTLFEVHDMARNEIIEQCKFRILSLKPQQSVSIIKLLGRLVQSNPYPMLEHVSRLKELLDYFSFMHLKTSTSLIAALLPLAKYSHDLQRYIVLVVRKAVFKREDTVRIASIDAIIKLMLESSSKNEPDSLQQFSSQASCSQQAELPNGIGVGLFQEMRGLLRRCLSQQATVKESMYWGLVKLVLSDTSVVGPVFEFLRPHFLQFFESKTSEEFKIKLRDCVKAENGILQIEEPLDCLVSCVSWLLFLKPQDKAFQQPWSCFGFSLSQDNEAARISSSESFADTLMKMRKFLRNKSLEDILGTNQDLGSQTLDGEKTSFYAWILSGIIQVLVNLLAKEIGNATDAQNIDLEKEIIDFVVFYDSLEKVACNKQGKSHRKGHPKANNTQDIHGETETREGQKAYPSKFSLVRSPFLSTSSISCLLELVVKISRCTDSENHNNQYVHLMSFTLKACLSHLKAFQSLEADSPLKGLIYGDIKVLGSRLLHLVWLMKSCSSLVKDQRKKDSRGRLCGDDQGEGLVHLGLSCLKELFNLVGTKFKLIELIEEMSKSCLEIVEDAGGGELFGPDLVGGENEGQAIHLFLVKVLRKLFTDLLMHSHFQELEVLSDIALLLAHKLPSDGRNSHGAWADSISRNAKVENVKATRSLVSLVISLSDSQNDLKLARGMASELLKVIGSEEMDPLENSETYPIINRSTANAIATLLLNLIESVIIDFEWMVPKLKALFSINLEETFRHKSSEQCGGKTPKLMLEDALYSRAESLVQVLSCFTEMSLKDPQAEYLLRLAAKFYKHLARITKLRIAPKGYRQALPGIKFQTLAEVTCKKLTGPLYKFVAVVQREQQENMQNRGMANKIKRENKCIPNLIFQIEDYEKYLIQLSKLTKVNLLRHAKRSTARDFKILDTRDKANQEERPMHASSPSTPEDSREESEEEEKECERLSSDPEPGAENGVLDPESGADDQVRMRVKSKGVKRKKVVQDSEEEHSE